jgi:16S rRNA (adenine1518-N6/adenine1519-N6)-dimethyltransferase
MRVRKRFGQHFLHDPTVVDRIVLAINPKPQDHLVEIGPGTAALTIPLLQRVGALDAVEIDRDLAATLRTQFATAPGFRLHECDALAMNWTALSRERGGPLRLVGNLPYNISTPLLFSLLAHAHAIQDMHFMLQKEVVDRIVAGPGSRTYGRLSVMLAPFTRCVRVLEVGPGAFRPPPKVHSTVVRITPVAAVPAWANHPRFAAVVTAAFGQRRKQLRNALGDLVDDAGFRAANVDPAERAENLSAAQFGALALQAGAIIA